MGGQLTLQNGQYNSVNTSRMSFYRVSQLCFGIVKRPVLVSIADASDEGNNIARYLIIAVNGSPESKYSLVTK